MSNIYVENSSDKINQIYNMFMKKEYGEIIYHNEVEEILGFDRTESRYGIYVKKAKDRLIEKSKVLKSIAGVGWQMLKPQQVSGYVYRKYIKRTLKSYDYSQDILYYLDKKDLSDERMQEWEEVTALNKELKEKTSKMIRESKYYSRKDYYNSIQDY